MRIHSDKITADDCYDALNLARQRGKVTGDVTFDPITAYNSQDKARAYEIQLGASVPGGLPENYVNKYGQRQKCRRVRNSVQGSGSYRFSATWEEWGWFIAYLYRADPNARWGSVKYPVYKDRDHFHRETHGQFAGV